MLESQRLRIEDEVRKPESHGLFLAENPLEYRRHGIQVEQRLVDIKHDQRKALHDYLGNRDANFRISSAISAAWVSSAKWPVSKKRTTASGMSRLNASAPGGRKNGSFRPQTARRGGLCVLKYF